jgi:vacuolar protein sorting-associated protein 13A/C
MFSGEIAEIINSKGNRKTAKRQSLDGLWIDYSWSVSKTALHVRINRLQIDNQLEYTLFPVMLHPVISKATGTDHAEKPFIELSILETKTGRSNIIQFKYFKLLIQEFAVKIDQGFIIAILAFLKSEDVRWIFISLLIFISF